MTALKIWISTARLRTLPLSLSGIIVGNAFALGSPNFSISLFALALLTAVALQILSNFANDYGDGVKGTDNETRIGPKRAVQQRLLSPKAILKGIMVVAFFALVCAFLLIYEAFGSLQTPEALFFQLLAVVAAVAAYAYTAGAYPYGYYGFGDVFVFLFFGLVAVVGSFYLQAHTLSMPSLWFFAITIGLLSVAVLNLNNLRDYTTDKVAKKNTWVVFIGPKRAKVYHTFLICGALLMLVLSLFVLGLHPIHGVFAIVFISLFLHLFRVWKIQNPIQFDPELKVVALSTFACAVLFFITQVTTA